MAFRVSPFSTLPEPRLLLSLETGFPHLTFVSGIFSFSAQSSRTFTYLAIVAILATKFFHYLKCFGFLFLPSTVNLSKAQVSLLTFVICLSAYFWSYSTQASQLWSTFDRGLDCTPPILTFRLTFWFSPAFTSQLHVHSSKVSIFPYRFYSYSGSHLSEL